MECCLKWKGSFRVNLVHELYLYIYTYVLTTYLFIYLHVLRCSNWNWWFVFWGPFFVAKKTLAVGWKFQLSRTSQATSKDQVLHVSSSGAEAFCAGVEWWIVSSRWKKVDMDMPWDRTTTNHILYQQKQQWIAVNDLWSISSNNF